MAKVIKSTVEGDYIIFKGKPLVRQGPMLCYGSMQDGHIMQLMVMNKKEVSFDDIKSNIPAMVIVQIMKKNKETGAWDPIKQFTKSGLHDAFMIGYNYLQSLSK